MPPRASTATERRCTDCGEVKTVSEFHGKGVAWDGTPKYQSYCRKCANKRRNVRGSDPEKVRQYSKTSYRRNHRQRLAYAEERRARPDVKQRDADKHLKRKYNLTREQWLKILDDQEGLCAICGTNLLAEKKICVDHDREAELQGRIVVRGLLCDPCNKGLGHFRDKLEIVERALTYLQRAKE